MIISKDKYNTFLPNGHMVIFYEDDKEIVDILVNYIKSNLENNTKCIYITGDADTEKIVENLKLVIDCDKYIENSQLLILNKEDAYSKSGTFVPDQMIDMLIKEADLAISDGYGGLAITGEISWVLDYEDGFDRIMEYEWKLNEYVFAEHPVSSICRYNLNKFSDDMIINVIQVHPYIIWKNKIHENPFYIPVEGFKTDQISKYQVRTWLENISKFTNSKGEFQITLERKERELIESEEKYKYVLDNSPIGKSITSLSGEIKINKTFCNMLSYSMEDIKGIKWESLTHPEDIEVSQNAIESLIKGEKKTATFSKRYFRKDGTILWVDIHTSLRRDLEGKPLYFMTSIIDISEKKKEAGKRLEMEAQLRNQQKLESIGNLASGVAHEINNPINGILNYGQIILDADPDDVDIKEYAKEIIHETNRVSEIVKNLLDFSRESKQEHSYSHIEDIVSQTLTLIRTVLKHDQIELNLNIAHDLPKIKCRSQQIQQVIMNLVTNAHDSLNERYPEYDKNKIMNLSCTQLKHDGRNWIQLIVEDLGVGVSDEFKDRIFDPFFTTKAREKGTGLGLSISYGIIKEHHGDLTFESEINKCTRFIMELP